MPSYWGQNYTPPSRMNWGAMGNTPGGWTGNWGDTNVDYAPDKNKSWWQSMIIPAVTAAGIGGTEAIGANTPMSTEPMWGAVRRMETERSVLPQEELATTLRTNTAIGSGGRMAKLGTGGDYRTNAMIDAGVAGQGATAGNEIAGAFRKERRDLSSNIENTKAQIAAIDEANRKAKANAWKTALAGLVGAGVGTLVGAPGVGYSVGSQAGSAWGG